MSDITVEKLMSRMPKAIRPEAAQGVDTVLQYHLTGSEPGEWYVTIKDGVCEVFKGVHDSPKMTLSADSDDYIAIFTGKSNAMKAFMEGKLKLSGDLNMAMKLPNLFKMT
jgi:putative sterol carrier protein